MFRHTAYLQFDVQPEKPDPVYARKLADFRANAGAEAQGRVQTARLYNMTDDPGVKNVLKFNLARDTLHQNLWLKAIEELQADGLEDTVAPNALFDEEHAEHATSVWHLSDGAAGQDGGWASGPQPDGAREFGYLADPEPSAASARPRRPTRSFMPPMPGPWASPAVPPSERRPAWPARSRTSSADRPAARPPARTRAPGRAAVRRTATRARSRTAPPAASNSPEEQA
jgi:Mn-containing catalase